MKILMATSEFAPFAVAGNLGVQVRTLAAELKKLGHDVSVVLPCYRSAREGNQTIQPSGADFQINLGGKRVTAEILETTDLDHIQTFLIRRDEYFDRSGIYGGEGRAYEDNAERFLFFSKAVLELARRLTPTPDIIHSHDWPAAMIPVFVKERQLPFQTVLSIHSLEHQGSFWSFDFALTNLPGSYFGARGVEFYGRLNFLKAGILYSDAVILPGELALNSSLTPEGGYGLHLVLQENAARTFGILPGVDYAVTNPPIEKLLPRRPRNGVGKALCREAVLKQFGLDPAPGLVIACPGAVQERGGFGKVATILDLILSGQERLIVLGDISSSQLPDYLVAERKYPCGIARAAENTKVRQLVLAGADLLLLPNLTEHEFVNAVTALRYGTIPATQFRGGISQWVKDYDPANESGAAFIYYRDTPAALWDAIQRAKQVRQCQVEWDGLGERARSVDFSWTQSALSFSRLYSSLLRHRRAA
jgi:starch synthase